MPDPKIRVRTDRELIALSGRGHTARTRRPSTAGKPIMINSRRLARTRISGYVQMPWNLLGAQLSKPSARRQNPGPLTCCWHLRSLLLSWLAPPSLIAAFFAREHFSAHNAERLAKHPGAAASLQPLAWPHIRVARAASFFCSPFAVFFTAQCMRADHVHN